METDSIQNILNQLNNHSEKIQKDGLTEIISSITKDTSILKFHEFQKYLVELIDIYEHIRGENKKKLADILSFLTITDRRTMEFRINGGVIPIKTFGFQYAKDLLKCSLIDELYDEKIFIEAIDVLFENNAEFEAIDFLFQFNKSNMILDYISDDNYSRTVPYIRELSNYIDTEEILYKIYSKFNRTIDKIILLINQVNIKCNVYDHEINTEIKNVFDNASELEKLQMCHIFYRTNYYAGFLKNQLYENIARGNKNKYYLDYAIKDFDIKYPETLKLENESDFLKLSLKYYSLSLQHKDFNDIVPNTINNMKKFISRCFTQQNRESTFDDLSHYIFSENTFESSAGIIVLAMNSKFYDPNHMAFATLKNSIENLQSTGEQDLEILIYLLLAIENIYSCTHSEVPRQFLLDFIDKKANAYENDFIKNLTCFILGSIYCGSYDDELISTFVFNISESDKEKQANCCFFLYLALGLVLMNNSNDNVKDEYGEKILKNLENNTKIPRECYILCKAMIKRGKKNFSDIEEFYEKTLFDFGEETFDDSYEGLSVHEDYLNSISLLTSAFSAKNDGLIQKFFSRVCMTASFMENDENYTALCFAFAFLYPSNPEQYVIDTIIGMGNSGSQQVVYASVITLAIVGAGTKNKQILDFLEDQRIIFGETDNILSLINYSEGLVNLGFGVGYIAKGYHDNRCMNIRGVVGLISFLYITFNMNEDRQTANEAKILLLLAKCFNTKIVTLIDEEQKILNEEVMIGTPINTIGVSGTPSDMTAVQIFKSPVVIQNSEKGKVEGYDNVVEDVVVLQKKD